MNQQALAFWRGYLDRLHVSASYAGNADLTDSLIALYLTGRKTAGSSVVQDFLSCGDRLPSVGDFWIVLDREERPRLLLRTVSIERHMFMDVPASVALAEGEGDSSLTFWREEHRRLYVPHLEKWGLARIEDAEIITEHFLLEKTH